MTSRPRKVKIGYKPYSVIAVKGLTTTAGVVGLCGKDTQEILFDPDVGKETLKEVLLHECIHGVWSQTALDRRFNDEEEELVIWSLTPLLLELLRDNHQLVGWLIGNN